MIHVKGLKSGLTAEALFRCTVFMSKSSTYPVFIHCFILSASSLQKQSNFYFQTYVDGRELREVPRSLDLRFDMPPNHSLILCVNVDAK